MNFLTVLLIFNLAPGFLSSEKLLNMGIIYASIGYSIITIIYKFFLPSLFPTDFTDNIFVQNWGHSYVADFLVFSIPLIITKTNHNKNISTIIVLLPVIIAIVISNSRSSIVALIIGVIFINTKNFFQKFIKFVTILGLLVSIVYIFFFANYLKSPNGSRPEYWSQAISGFISSPLVGIGPGNFGIINRLYRQTGTSNANYAHNSVLELLSGNGILFTLLAFGLIFLGLRYQYQHHRLYFVIGIISLINSFLDPTWSSPGILIVSLIFIFWKTKVAPSPKSYLFSLAFLVGLFLVSKTSSDIFFSKGNYNLSLKLDPFNPSPLAQLVKTHQPQIRFLYRQDPYFLNILTDIKYLPQNEPDFYESIRLDPHGSTNQLVRLFYYYSSINDYQKLERVALLLDDHLNLTDLPFNLALEIAKSLYKLGLYEWQQKDYPAAISHFEKAVIYSRNWSHFQLELAAALWHSGQTNKAADLLNNCQNDLASVTHCHNFMLEVIKSGWPIPGRFAKTISELQIPVDVPTNQSQNK
ncbi:MAG: O-antigen ligase family protein [Candidatus Shapirobacteria bacterium]|jgi:hypothetical protein